MESNQVNLSKAAAKGRNAACRRKWNFKENTNQIRVNYPPTQRSCNAGACTLDGCQKLTAEDRQYIYKNFWHKSADEKFMIESLCMSRVEGTIFWKYTLPKNGYHFVVCNENFRETLDITTSAIERIQKKLKAGQIFPRKMTGRHDNRPHRIPEDFKEAAVHHMFSFPRVHNHYARGHVDEDTVFLKPPLTILEMYNEFISLYEDDDEVDMKMSEAYYRQIFHSKKIRIGIPKMDTCAVCDFHQNQIDHNRKPRKVARHRQLKQEHLDKVEEARRELRADREKARQNPDKVALLMIDAQKTLYTPQLSTANAFFGTKYATHNVCINDEAKNDPTMFLWDQTTAGIGANEIGSCILKYVKDNFQPLQAGQERELIVWSDRCKSQNNNWFMLCLYSQLQHLKYFTSVKQKFLITGHSYNSCDSNFGLIEKRLKVDRVTYPPEFVNVLRSARPSDPFKIVQMTQAMFFSLNNLYKFLKKPRLLKVSRHISFKLDSRHPNLIVTKKVHSENCDEEHYQMKFYSALIDVSQMPLITDSPAYPGGLIPIKDNLRSDLQKLHRFLPPRAKAWFKEQLKIGQNNDETDTDDDSDESSGDED